MKRDRAAYMREYRARKRVIDMTTMPGRVAASFDIVKADLRIQELEAEVRHLKAELAKRPGTISPAAEAFDGNIQVDAFPARFNTRPFTPVPKVRRRG